MSTPAFRTLLYAVEDGVARVTINRPERRNALSLEAVNDLIVALETARDDPVARVIVLTGAGKSFCAGGDLLQMGGDAGGGGASGVPWRGGFVELNLAFTKVGKPTVAMVNGHAMGGGLGLVLACDLAVAAAGAQFGFPEVNVGLFPMVVMANLCRTAPRKRALELVLTGRKFPAEEALALGIVNRVAPPERLAEETAALVSELGRKSPATLRLGLEAFYGQQDLAIEDALKYLNEMLTRCMSTEDFQEGVLAFVQKRDPVWKGR